MFFFLWQICVVFCLVHVSFCFSYWLLEIMLHFVGTGVVTFSAAGHLASVQIYDHPVFLGCYC